MLVLTRKYQEKIRIGENITITVLRMKGKAVRLGIEAPTDVPVVRGELAFEVNIESADGQTPAIAEETAEDNLARSGRQVVSAGAMTAEWSTDSHPSAAPRSRGKKPATSVGFSRIPRDKVATLMPKLVSGNAPLRAIMEQR